MANQISLNLPREADWVVVDAPAGLQGYKLTDYLAVDKVIVPLVPSVFDMAATEDFLIQCVEKCVVCGQGRNRCNAC
jgi:chromosome partitioning protein